MKRINWKAIEWSKQQQLNVPLYTQPRKYWIEVDIKTGNPTGKVTWAYYKDDKPIEGNYILVEEVIDEK